MTGAPVMTLRGLCVDYLTEAEPVHAVADVDLVLHRGEVLGLAGESGSGKSTLAYAVTRLLRSPGAITAGEAVFHSAPSRGVAADVDLLGADEGVIRSLRWSQIAVVFQSAMNSLNPVLRIGAQLTDVLAAHLPDLSRSDRLRRAEELLTLVGIDPGRLRAYPHELSGGMRQRVMIAMALALEPQVLIMDEPTTALDVVTQREILQELAGLRTKLAQAGQGFAVLFITHDLSLLIELADTIAVMYAGRIVEHAPAAQLFRAPRHPYTYGLINSFPALSGDRRAMTGIAGSPPDLRKPPSGCPFHPRCAHALPVCTTDRPPLRRPAGARSARVVACVLHDGRHHAPPELAAPEPDVRPAVAAGPIASQADLPPEPARSSP